MLVFLVSDDLLGTPLGIFQAFESAAVSDFGISGGKTLVPPYLVISSALRHLHSFIHIYVLYTSQA